MQAQYKHKCINITGEISEKIPVDWVNGKIATTNAQLDSNFIIIIL